MRVVIGEDLFLLRDGLVRLLEAHGFEIAAAVGTAPGLRAALTGLKPDVSIAGVRMPPTHTDDGLRVAIEARRVVPGLPVLVLSQYVEQLYAAELLADHAGGVGYLLKDRVFSDAAFAEAVRDVAAGGTVLDPEVVARLMARRNRSGPLTGLTPREREVLALMAEGRSNAAIAARLFIAEKSVAKHAAGIFTRAWPSPTTTTGGSWRFSPTSTADPLNVRTARLAGSPKLFWCENGLNGMSPWSAAGRPDWPPPAPRPPPGRGR